VENLKTVNQESSKAGNWDDRFRSEFGNQEARKEPADWAWDFFLSSCFPDS
jgi:hypothetical protein